jgi:hypothetical protein
MPSSGLSQRFLRIASIRDLDPFYFQNLHIGLGRCGEINGGAEHAVRVRRECGARAPSPLHKE